MHGLAKVVFPGQIWGLPEGITSRDEGVAPPVLPGLRRSSRCLPTRTHVVSPLAATLHHHEGMARTRTDELAAQACIRAALPGCSAELQDDGSRPSMYDLKIVYPDGTTGAVEVTAAADAPRTGLWQEVRKRSLIRQEPDLVGGWLVRILTSAQARELDRHLPGLLRDAEQAGRKVIWGSRSSTDDLSARAGKLRVIEAFQSPTDRPGSIYIMPPEGSPDRTGGYSPPTGDPLAEWLAEWVADPKRADNVHKLVSADVDERHIFVVVPSFPSVPFAVNDLLTAPGAPLPTLPPDLPAGISHAWTMSIWDSGDGFRWSPDGGWTRFTKVPLPETAQGTR